MVKESSLVEGSYVYLPYEPNRIGVIVAVGQNKPASQYPDLTVEWTDGATSIQPWYSVMSLDERIEAGERVLRGHIERRAAAAAALGRSIK
jgi:hypothetical protein